MTSTIARIADAVVEELNSGEYSQEFTAARSYLPVYELKEIKDLQVTVVPKGIVIESNARSGNQRDVAIDVAVQKKLAATDNTAVDPLLAIVEEIAGRFRQRRLATYSDAIWVKTENDPVYVQEHLDQLRTFTSVLTLVFRVIQ